MSMDSILAFLHGVSVDPACTYEECTAGRQDYGGMLRCGLLEAPPRDGVRVHNTYVRCTRQASVGPRV